MRTFVNNLCNKLARSKGGLSALGPAKMMAAGVLVGAAVGLAAVGFRFLINLSSGFFFPHDPRLFGLMGHWWRYLAAMIPALGGLIVGLALQYLLGEQKGISGMPEVLWSVAVKGGRLRPRMGIKGLLSAVTMGSGGSAGPEGPIVEIGSSLSSYFGQKTGLSLSENRLFAGCGAAAGIAGVFGAPLGGLFFALEVVLGEFSISSFTPVVLSAVAASVVSRSFFGDQPAFQVTVVSLGSLWDTIPYLLLGIFSGLVSVLFVSSISRSQEFFRGLPLPLWGKTALGGLAVGVIGLATPQVLGEGYHAVTSALAGNLAWWLALSLMLAKILATAGTLGSGAPGGAFAPALFVGAMLGSAFNQAASEIFPKVFAFNPSYPLAGAAGLVAGSLGAPIAAGLIVFEVSGTYRVVLPCLIAVAASAAIAHRMKRGSLYTQTLANAGLPVEQLRRLPHLSAHTCRQAMRRQLTAVLPGAPLTDIIKIFSSMDQELLPVIDADNRYLGAICWSQLRCFLAEGSPEGPIIAHDVMLSTPTVLPEDSLSLALMHLIKEDLQELPVVEEGKLVGLLEGKAILGGRY